MCEDIVCERVSVVICIYVSWTVNAAGLAACQLCLRVVGTLVAVEVVTWLHYVTVSLTT